MRGASDLIGVTRIFQWVFRSLLLFFFSLPIIITSHIGCKIVLNRNILKVDRDPHNPSLGTALPNLWWGPLFDRTCWNIPFPSLPRLVYHFYFVTAGWHSKYDVVHSSRSYDVFNKWEFSPEREIMLFALTEPSPLVNELEAIKFSRPRSSLNGAAIALYYYCIVFSGIVMQYNNWYHSEACWICIRPTNGRISNRTDWLTDRQRCFIPVVVTDK